MLTHPSRLIFFITIFLMYNCIFINSLQAAEEMQCWIKNNGYGPYCMGFLSDCAYDEQTCILCPPQPSIAHTWNAQNGTWVITVEAQRNYIRMLRDIELQRTDKYVLFDYFALFTQEEQEEIVSYRQQLRNAPNHDTLQSIIMPECPQCIYS